jgi:phenylacetate-CoA ligase
MNWTSVTPRAGFVSCGQQPLPPPPACCIIIMYVVPERLSEIRQLPGVTKAELMPHFDDWVTDPSVTRVQIEVFLADPGNVGRDFLGRYVVCTTSGATGIPAIVVHEHTALVVYNVLGYARSLPALLLSPGPVWALLRGRGRLAAVFVTGGHFLGNTMMARRIRKMPWRGRMQRIFSALAPIEELVSDLNAFNLSCWAAIPALWKLWPMSSKPAGCTSTLY